MKTQITFPKPQTRILSLKDTFNSSLSTSSMLKLFSLFLLLLLATNSVFAQTERASTTTATQNEITVKGMVSDEQGPLAGVTVLLKGSNTGVVTDKNGAFTFPKALKPNDILVFSYLGYETQEIKITEKTNFITLVLTTDLIEIMGAVNSDKPYKSKRSN